MTNYLSKHINTPIPQTQQAEPNQVKNNAGGFVFEIPALKRVERFLILGSEGGTYYVGESDLTQQNLDNLRNLTATDPKAVIDLAVDVSDKGRSYRNDAASFVLAYVMTHGNDEAKSYARQNFNRIVRTGTHFFQSESFLKSLATGSGLGTSRNRALASWYESKETDALAYQAIKYRQRHGWTHRDSLRQARPKGIDPNLGNWILGKEVNTAFLPEIVKGFIRAQNTTDVRGILEVLNDYPGLPWEAIPTQFHKAPELWRKLFYNGQLKGQALVRNITRLARLGLFDDTVFAHDYAAKLTDETMISKTRLHPIQYLNALIIYTEGQLIRVQPDKAFPWAYRTTSGQRKKDWTDAAIITDALNEGVHLSFKHVQPAGKRTLLAVDVSGSMTTSFGMGLDLSAAQFSGVMAATIARTEPYYQIMGFANEFRDLGITAKMDLKSVMSNVKDRNFGSTDCSLPMNWASQNNLNYDTFVVITDGETWAGYVHPHIALQNYRQKTGIDAKLIVVGVTSTGFSIANPNDPGMLDVAGADANLPKVIAEFSAGRI